MGRALRRVSRRAAVLVVLLGLLGAAGGTWWGMGQAAVHESTAVILVNPLEGNPFSPEGSGDDLVNLETEAQLVRSDAMGELVAERVDDGRTSDELLETVKVSVPTNTQLLEITTTGSSDAAANASAQAFAETYVEYRRTRTDAAVFEKTARINEQIADRNRERLALLAQLAALSPTAPRAPLLNQQLATLTTQVGELRSQLSAFTSVARDPGQVVTPATATPGGLPGGIATAAVLGLLVGAALGLVLALALGRLDNAVRRPEDLAAREARYLGELDLDPAGDPEQVARVRTALLAVDRRRPLVVLTTTLGGPDQSVRQQGHQQGQGGTGLALAVARSLAASHLMTVVVEVVGSETRRQRGLTDLLQGRATLDQVLSSPSSHLSVLPTGTDQARLDDLAAAPATGARIRELADRADVVLLACGGPDEIRTQALVALADVLVLEVHQGEASVDEVDAATADLARLGVRDICSVFVPAPRRQRRRPGAALARVRPSVPGRKPRLVGPETGTDRDG